MRGLSDPSMNVEVHVALMDKSDSFVVTHNIPTFKKLVDNHLFSGAPVAEAAAQISALEVAEFSLLMKQVSYGQTVFENWQKQGSSVHAAQEHALHKFKLNRTIKAIDMANVFVLNCCKFTV